MESKEPKQSEQGQVSAQGESPKDEEQNTFTEDEIRLAAKYQVEPKLVRLLNEIVKGHYTEEEKATPITVLQNWLSKRSYAEKLTAVTLWQLINKEHIYKAEGYCKGRIGNELFREYEQAVVNASQDKDYLTTADSEEVSVTGLITGLLPMQV